MPICVLPSPRYSFPDNMEERAGDSPYLLEDEQDMKLHFSPKSEPDRPLSPLSKKRKSLHSHLEAIAHKVHAQPNVFKMTEPSSSSWPSYSRPVSQPVPDDEFDSQPTKIPRIEDDALDSFAKRSPWGRPRGRRTIQDKIAEQQQRAADLEEELRLVGLSRGGSPRDLEPSPTLAKLGKPGTGRKGTSVVEQVLANRKTVPVSVIRKSPAVPTDFNGSKYCSLPVSRSPTPPSPKQHIPESSLLNYMPISSLAEGGYFSFPSNVVVVPSMVFQIPGLPAPGPIFIPQGSSASFPTLSSRHGTRHSVHERFPLIIPPESVVDDSASDLFDAPKSQREERLSTKLKRIKAKAGQPSQDSPRGFLSQKIETLKRRESCLQQEFEEVINTPITRNGISSAQVLQRHYAATEQLRDRPSQNAVLFHMLRHPAQTEEVWQSRRLQKE